MTQNTSAQPDQPTVTGPSWATEDLIVCHGGPWNGWWFTAADWRERQQAAERMARHQQRSTAISDYARTEIRKDHPRIAEASGVVWTAGSTGTGQGGQE